MPVLGCFGTQIIVSQPPPASARTPVDVGEVLSRFSEYWSPKTVARLNDYEVKVVKLQGEFVWHTHHDTGELFLVIGGRLTIQLRDGMALAGLILGDVTGLAAGRLGGDSRVPGAFFGGARS